MREKRIVTTDYPDAANRHRNDADLLLESKRLPNADQLYGLAAECALKAVLTWLGMETTVDGAPKDKRRYGHINRLWGEFLSFANGHEGACYAAMLPQTNPFDNWDVGQRYGQTTSIAEATVHDHERGTTAAFAVLSQARMDGRG